MLIALKQSDLIDHGTLPEGIPQGLKAKQLLGL
jgi:hypothetical protein